MLRKHSCRLACSMARRMSYASLSKPPPRRLKALQKQTNAVLVEVLNRIAVWPARTLRMTDQTLGDWARFCYRCEWMR